MKERLIQLLDLEHLTPSKFADLIGVQRSSVSHILSGRNKPSFDFLQKTLKTFPGLKAEWLLMGDGPIYEQMGRDGGDLFNQGNESIAPLEPAGHIKPSSDEFTADLDPEPELPVNLPSEEAFNNEIQNKTGEEPDTDKIQYSKEVVQVVLLYKDNTFSTYKPS